MFFFFIYYSHVTCFTSISSYFQFNGLVTLFHIRSCFCRHCRYERYERHEWGIRDWRSTCSYGHYRRSRTYFGCKKHTITMHKYSFTKLNLKKKQLGEELSTDILNDVLLNSNKVDNVLTWL